MIKNYFNKRDLRSINIKGIFKILPVLFFLLFTGNMRSQVTVTCVPPMSTGCTSGDYIDLFQLNGISATGNTGCNAGANGYTLYTSPVWNLTMGQTYTWSVTYGPSLLQCLGIWIDLNNDGQYTANEMLANTPAAALSHTGTITIPVTATAGTNIRMRTRCKWNSAFATGGLEACAGYTWGETEDHYVNIISCAGANLTVSPVSASVCPGATASFTASGASSYTWSGGFANGASFTPTGTSVYTVTAGFSSGCTSTATAQLFVYPPLTINASTTNICTGSTVTLTANGGSGYTWVAGPASNSITASPTSNTSYSVHGTTNAGCSSDAAVTITVLTTAPVLTVTNSSASNANGICPTKTVVLTASGANTYTWTGGSTAVTNGSVFSPGTSATYTLNATNVCGLTSAVTSVSIHPLPVISPAASSSSICSGNSVTLTATGTSTSYAWSGHTIPITAGTGFSPIVTATYSVLGTSALGCTAIATIPVTVVTTPVIAPIANPILICIGGSSTLTATGATNYTWTSSSQTSFNSSLVATPSSTGISTYTVTKANSNCVDTKVISITTNALPAIFAIASPTLVCALSPATLAVGGGQSYTWTAPGNNTFGGPSPIVYPASSSNYTVAASDGTCISVTTVSVATNPNPTVTAIPTSSTICKGQSVTLTASGGMNYTWTATSGGTFYTSAITETPGATVAYDLIGDNSFGCTSLFNQVIIVNPNPTLTAVANKVLICSGSPSTLTATGANNYTWTSNNAQTNTTVVNATNAASGPVIYTVLGSYTTGCASSKTVGVNVYVPALTVSGNTNTCLGGLLSLSGGGGNAGSYSWNTGTSINNFQTLTTTLSASAVFTLSANSTSVTAVCPATKTVAVGVFYNPTITAVAQRTVICIKESVDLYGNGGASYSWNNGSTGGTITVAPTIQTTYTVTGTDPSGCVSTGVVLIKVSNCVGINELNNSENALLIYPNPNSGEFNIQAAESMNLVLSNELGQTVRFISLSGSDNYKIRISDLSKGIYFISGQKDNLRINQKIIVTK